MITITIIKHQQEITKALADVVAKEVAMVEADVMVVEVEEIMMEHSNREVDGNKPCLIHPGTKHSWNECNKNPNNQKNNNVGFQARGGGRGTSNGGCDFGRGNYYQQ